jgi:hypothetical protein
MYICAIGGCLFSHLPPPQLTLLEVMAHCVCNENFGRNEMFGVLYLLHFVTLTDDIDNVNLSSPFHYP